MNVLKKNNQIKNIIRDTTRKKKRLIIKFNQNKSYYVKSQHYFVFLEYLVDIKNQDTILRGKIQKTFFLLINFHELCTINNHLFYVVQMIFK